MLGVVNSLRVLYSIYLSKMELFGNCKKYLHEKTIQGI